MKIVLISSSISPNSGWGTLTYNHVSYLYKRGIPFQLFLPWNAEKVEVPFADQISYELPMLPLTFKGFKNLMKSPLLWLANKKFSEKVIIHSLVDFPYNLIGWRWAKKNKCPFIYSAIGTYSVRPFTKVGQRQLLLEPFKKACKVISISEFTAQQSQKVSGYKRPIEVINLPVAEPARLTISQNNSFDILASAKVILSVGPLKFRKGMDILIKALPDIIKKIPNAHLVIVGDGDKEKHYQLLDSAKDRQRLLILPRISSEDLDQLFRRCNLFAMTSRYINHNFEGYGLVYLEAGLYKKPVVAADSGGVSDAVHHQETGLLVPENDIEATAAAVVQVLSDDNLAQRLGEGNYKLAQERNWDDYIDRIIDIYRSI
jgi:phosphatidylinositol alpha-1,6-mannosyltransferase